jgi:hypothetical protein
MMGAPVFKGLFVLAVGVDAGGRVIELMGNTPRFIFGQQATQLTLLYNTSESEKLTCTGEFEAKDVRIAGTTTTVSDLMAEMVAMKAEMAQLKTDNATMGEDVSQLKADNAAKGEQIAQLTTNVQLIMQSIGDLTPHSPPNISNCTDSVWYPNSAGTGTPLPCSSTYAHVCSDPSFGQYIKAGCPVTCNLCSAPLPTQCTDSVYNYGSGSSMPCSSVAWMCFSAYSGRDVRAACPATCNLCSTSPSPQS